MQQYPRIKWFVGLDALRFFAAAMVVLMHLHLALKQTGLIVYTELPIMLKGYAAVSFFFVLSGFLISYLLFGEIDDTKTVNTKVFYLKRVFRIWPLYFFVVAFGVAFYWFLMPRLNIETPTDYNLGVALIGFLFFGANAVSSFFHVGGILHITWSIAVEEQFYLFWAPLMKRFQNNLLAPILATIAVFYGLIVVNEINLFGWSADWQVFIKTLQFHNMGVGALAAWFVHRKRDYLLNLWVFKSKLAQSLLTLATVSFYLFYQKSTLGEVLLPIPMALLYAWLIINVSINTKKLYTFSGRFLNRLGQISFGLYMLHMPVVYALVFVIQKMFHSLEINYVVFGLVFFTTLTISLVVAELSSRILEKPILKAGRSFIKRISTFNKPAESTKIKTVFYEKSV